MPFDSSSTPSPVAHLRLLAQTILTSIDAIESHLSHSSSSLGVHVAFPTLQDLFSPNSPTEKVLNDEAIHRPVAHLVAAAHQLISTVQSPVKGMVELGMSYHIPACLRAVLESDAVEVVRDAGKEGIHVNELANRINRDPMKLSRIMRLLANNHIFIERSPDVFANNRLSSVLDTGKSLEELRANPQDKHTGTSGMPAFILHSTDEVMKGASYLPEAFSSPETAFTSNPGDAPWNLAFGTKIPIFQWFDLEENGVMQRRFAEGMKGLMNMEPRDAILQGFKWDELKEGSTIVDVGGGVGSSSMAISKKVENVKIVVQDRAPVIAEAKEYWAHENPTALDSSCVQLQIHNFFDEQPIKDASVFLVRFIIHDWADPIALQILRRLRAAATPETKLVTVDVIVPGASVPKAPEGIQLQTLGIAGSMPYLMDLQMYVFCNSQDRTLGHFVSLAAEARWRVVQVHRIPGSNVSQCVSVPM
ncbi:O-methyltransferase [Cyathus striatus]|nr:O-methyltransferase [Cyathus striatus]